jgi:hypothetical protein
MVCAQFSYMSYRYQTENALAQEGACWGYRGQERLHDASGTPSHRFARRRLVVPRRRASEPISPDSLRRTVFRLLPRPAGRCGKSLVGSGGPSGLSSLMGFGGFGAILASSI